jgi:membrane peptidoglycan carboxypeptidase
MSSATDIIRRRRNRSPKSSLRSDAIKWLLVLTIIVAGVSLISLALIYANLTAGFSPLEDIELAFGTPGAESYQPLGLYDRSGEILIYESVNPKTADRKWMRIRPGGVSTIPDHVLDAIVAAIDETYWSNPGYDPETLRLVLGHILRRKTEGTFEATITQRLAMTYLLPLGEEPQPESVDFLRSSLLAADMNRRYSKEQILEWFVNSTHFGNMAYGIDAAALLYFDKHATDLSLAEAAVLAAFLKYPDLPQSGDERAIQSAQEEVIEKMIALGMAGASLAEDALHTSVEVKWETDNQSSGFALQARNQLESMLGSHAIHRSGMRAITTIDYDLQVQTECVAKTQQERLSGASLEFVANAEDRSACVAAGLLPTLRPRDVGVDHKVTDFSVVVIDPGSGEILSMVGQALRPRTAGTIFQPFIYVTAFAQGYSPGSMILDVPPSSDISNDTDLLFDRSANNFHGPVRMRTALANSYGAAAVQTVDLVGVDRVLRTANLMGLHDLTEIPEDDEMLAVAGTLKTNLIETTYSYSLFANYGKMVGVSETSETTDHERVEPVSILSVQDAAGRWVYVAETQMQAVLSPQLAYLMADVLGDEAARWPEYGQFGVLDIGRPAGVQTGVSYQNRDNWAIGFTPSIVVGVWVGSGNGEMQDIDALNGAAAVWRAIIRYATRDVPPTGWTPPAGIVHLDVCDPSGLLPTAYCPVVVRETFISGTEPTTQDNLFQPYLVNRETGKLATTMTPLDLIEERVYMIPPPGAETWAESEDIPSPPSEYDTMHESGTERSEIDITYPAPFDTIRGKIRILGNAFPTGLDFYRLQFGRGLNPVRWTQIGQDVSGPVTDGLLGTWDTTDLNGLFTLQLVTVLQDGQLVASESYITVDNTPPTIQLLSPDQGLVINVGEIQEVVLEAEVEDEIEVDRVIFYINGAAIAEFDRPPYSMRWALQAEGEYVFQVKAYDRAGNLAESEQIIFSVAR